jgi:hypothetical protein
VVISVGGREDLRAFAETVPRHIWLERNLTNERGQSDLVSEFAKAWVLKQALESRISYNLRQPVFVLSKASFKYRIA